jgi:hypothetical protein
MDSSSSVRVPVHSYPQSPPPPPTYLLLDPRHHIIGIINRKPRCLRDRDAADREARQTDMSAEAQQARETDEYDSEQPEPHIESSDGASTNLSDGTEDESEVAERKQASSSAPKQRVFGRDQSILEMACIPTSNHFGALGALIAEHSQGNWHYHLQKYSVDDILRMLEYDPTTCWDAVEDTADRQVRHSQERVIRRKTRRVLVRLHSHGIRIADLMCWLPPIDQTRALATRRDNLCYQRKRRRRSHRRAARFFDSRPPSSSSSNSHAININSEHGQETWHGYLQLLVAPDEETHQVTWSLRMDHSFRDAWEEKKTLEKESFQAPPPRLHRQRPFSFQSDDATTDEEAELDAQADAEWEHAWATAPPGLRADDLHDLQTDSETDVGAVAADEKRRNQSNQEYHPLHYVLSYVQPESEWGESSIDYKRAMTPEEVRRKQLRVEHNARKILRLSMAHGPASGDFDATLAFLQTTTELHGCVHKNALTDALLDMLAMPNDRLCKAKRQNRTFSMSMRLRALCLKALLHLDVRIIEHVSETVQRAPPSLNAPLLHPEIAAMRRQIVLGLMPLLEARQIGLQDVSIGFSEKQQGWCVRIADFRPTPTELQKAERTALETKIRAWFAHAQHIQLVRIECVKEIARRNTIQARRGPSCTFFWRARCEGKRQTCDCAIPNACDGASRRYNRQCSRRHLECALLQYEEQGTWICVLLCRVLSSVGCA